MAESFTAKGGFARVMVLLVILMIGLPTALGDLVKIGGPQGWSPNVNYTDWSINHQAYVGDWLYFVFDKRYFSVLEVNQTDYLNCNDNDFIKNITKGGRDVYQVTEARPYYFLSSGGYCYQGMKVAVKVEEPILVPSPAPSKSGSSPSLLSFQEVRFNFVVSLLISMVVMWPAPAPALGPAELQTGLVFW